MALDEEFGRRARIALARMNKPPQLKDIAAAVRERANRATLTPQAVGGWFRGQEPESFALTRAFAEVLKCDPSWLAFGTPEADSATAGATGHSGVSNPVAPDPLKDRKLTEAEVARAVAKSASETRAPAKRGTKRRGTGRQ